MWTRLLGNKTTWLAWCSMSLLVRSCVPTVLQQNMTIVQRASCFRWETHSFLCVWMAPRQRDDPSSPPMWTAGGGELRRGGLHGKGFVIDSQSPDGEGIQGQWPVALAASVSPASVREWLDGWTCDTKSDDRVREGGVCVSNSRRCLVWRNAERLS